MPEDDLRELRNRKINMVFQHFALFPHRTVRENAAYALHVRTSPRPRGTSVPTGPCETVGLGDWGDALPGELSGGMRQRVGLARALASDADILLMDEPFSALDPLIRRDMQDLLMTLQRDLQRTVVFVTHDLNEAMRMGDRIMIMRNGKVVQLGTAQEILNTPADDYVSEFISDVDRSRVLTAGTIMQQPLVTATERDDPEDVLRRLSNVEGLGAYVLERRRRDRRRRPRGPAGRGRGPPAHDAGAARDQRVQGRRRGHAAERHLLARRPQQRAARRHRHRRKTASASFRERPCSPRSPPPGRTTAMPDIDVGAPVGALVDWLTANFGPFFHAISAVMLLLLDAVLIVLTAPSPLIVIVVFVALALLERKWGFGLFTLLAFLLILAMGLWVEAMQTLALVVVATVFAVAIGIPVGIWAARSRRVSNVVRPVLDFMQTLPVFVYLIPAVFFFGIGAVPGVIATLVFAIPPAVRLTELGIRSVDKEVTEASIAFGAKPRQMLREVQLPLALPSIMAGVNQTLMLALSCVVIAGLVGAGGLGAVVVRGISTLDVGAGFEGGIAVVFLAIYLDRLTSALAKPRRRRTKTRKPTTEAVATSRPADTPADQAALASS